MAGEQQLDNKKARLGGLFWEWAVLGSNQ